MASLIYLFDFFLFVCSYWRINHTHLIHSGVHRFHLTLALLFSGCLARVLDCLRLQILTLHVTAAAACGPSSISIISYAPSTGLLYFVCCFFTALSVIVVCCCCTRFIDSCCSFRWSLFSAAAAALSGASIFFNRNRSTNFSFIVQLFWLTFFASFALCFYLLYLHIISYPL